MNVSSYLNWDHPSVSLCCTCTRPSPQTSPPWRDCIYVYPSTIPAPYNIEAWNSSPIRGEWRLGQGLDGVIHRDLTTDLYRSGYSQVALPTKYSALLLWTLHLCLISEFHSSSVISLLNINVFASVAGWHSAVQCCKYIWDGCQCSYLRLVGKVWCVYIVGRGTCEYPLRIILWKEELIKYHYERKMFFE